MPQTPQPHRSRLGHQPAPRPTASSDSGSHERPPYSALSDQLDAQDYGPLLPHLPELVRTTLGLSDGSGQLRLDGPTRRRIRNHYLAEPSAAAALPEELRTMLAL